ncbi:MAG: DNA-directed RNA polymerase subunit alpha [Candidatus Portnoybacteria bacterium CG10_big_fil_rev_8_21_14_0_10_36_7]|uniref:DNA-directed RNA polymerase subunit alpha n=1 Tax=Candidatus Portnoybacteria bacterium CG10_big_fil_rev_8_21_14_0_10_36_7 TaxID=1974812 RepID=A0A2M8KEJ4_9BACT|nr:MAG: DNA-directed RNA polymerase subunit alpha [Candidatus Portnoybacteria bacterium CG10_big_fil_rev_8_21_14_0_10_36_7]
MQKISLPQTPKVVLEENNRAIFEIEGCWPGYGITLGNALRRALLSSLSGAGVTAIKIAGVQHEFSAIHGVLENVIDIILNLKKLRFRLHSDEPQIVKISAKGEKEITGKDLECPSQVEIVSKNALIATITDKKAVFEAEIEVSSGIGFLATEQRKAEKLDIGRILVDGIFTPIRKVNFEVTNMRVGDRTDFNKLTFDIETDGSITPQEAFMKAGEILVEQFSALAQGFQIQESKESEAENKDKEADEEIVDPAKIKIEDMKLSSRTIASLESAGIKTAAGLSKKSEYNLLELKGMGEKGLVEVRKALEKVSLTLKEK